MKAEPSGTLGTKRQETVYTFRSMKELDSLISKSELRVHNAEKQLRSDTQNAISFVRQAFTMGRIARKIGFLNIMKAAYSMLLKKKK